MEFERHLWSANFDGSRKRAKSEKRSGIVALQSRVWRAASSINYDQKNEQ